MAKDTTGKGGAAATEAQGNGQAPTLNILAQYIKDLSFENPGAPKSLGPREKAPDININVNVNFPQEHMLPLLFIECPRMLFPFARQIVADATRNGGFPPLLVDPIDFAQMFQQRMAEENAKAQVANKAT